MSDEQRPSADKLTIKQLIGMMTPGQFRTVLVAILGAIGVVFAAGAWVNEIRNTATMQAQLESMVSKARHEEALSGVRKSNETEIDSLTTSRNTAERQLQDATAKWESERAQIDRQIEYLERCHSYLNARIRGEEDNLNNESDEAVASSQTLFVVTLKRLYKGGDKTAQKKDGYEINESEALNHRIIFNGAAYRIPLSVKGNFVSTF